VNAVFPNTIEIKGWRSEVTKLCCQWVAYYEAKTDIFYVEHSLHASLWFKKEDNMLRFVNEVDISHNTFCSQFPQIEWDFSCEPKVSPSLIPVMMNHYDSSTSQSPQHTDIPFHESSSSVVSVRLARVYFRLVEEINEFFDVKPTGCHIADKSIWNQHDDDKDNRLYLTQKLHSQFDGMQTNDSIPHVGIYFVENKGEELVTFEGASFSMHRVIVGFEIPFEGVAARIKFKEGTYHRGGVYFTHIHVDNPANVKKYLDLKYHKTMNIWDSKGISYTHSINLDEEYLES
jgi:hypothetical protein